MEIEPLRRGGQNSDFAVIVLHLRELGVRPDQMGSLNPALVLSPLTMLVSRSVDQSAIPVKHIPQAIGDPIFYEHRVRHCRVNGL